METELLKNLKKYFAETSQEQIEKDWAAVKSLGFTNSPVINPDHSEIEKLRYLKNPDKCPYCYSDIICGDDSDFIGNFAFRTVECKSCHTEWQEEFVLTNITKTVI